jgi:SAM-dependent methyltransferase
LRPEQLRGKRLLDVGCGDGSLSNAIASGLGAEVIAFDLSTGMTRSVRNARAFFIQADATDPPFKPDSFDVIWAGGSIHHTRDTRETFIALTPLLKPGGRIGIWVYGSAREQTLRRSAKSYITIGLQKLLFDHLGRSAQDAAIGALARVGMVKQDLEERMGIRRRPKCSLAQKKARLRDGLTVKYQHQHSRPEVRSWFGDAGLTRINCRRLDGAVVCYGDREGGLGVRDDRRAAESPPEWATAPAR